VETKAAHVITLSGDLTIRHASEIQAYLAGRIEKFASIELDCTAVTDTDLSFLQLLIAARNSAIASGKSIRVKPDRAGCVGELARRAGLAEALGLEADDGDSLSI
jgi:ABC-type transporter Mla MlaB component